MLHSSWCLVISSASFQILDRPHLNNKLISFMFQKLLQFCFGDFYLWLKLKKINKFKSLREHVYLKGIITTLDVVSTEKHVFMTTIIQHLSFTLHGYVQYSKKIIFHNRNEIQPNNINVWPIPKKFTGPIVAPLPVIPV